MRIILGLILLMPALAFAQFDPAGGKAGSLAVHRNASGFIAWGDSVKVERGYQQINDQVTGKPTLGEPVNALGAADGSTVSLGDGGTATYLFDKPIADVPGFDFVVFENGFGWVEGYFLELAFVEVSSNGTDFIRFPAEYKGDTATQFDNMAAMEPEWFRNLAGKHQSPYGTPFDLEELKDSSPLDITKITHIRIVDAVGSLIDSIATRDVHGNKINDPWPTNFVSSGFDLDAVGVLDANASTGNPEAQAVRIWPNPVRSGDQVTLNQNYDKVAVQSLSGQVIRRYSSQSSLNMDLPAGVYQLTIVHQGQNFTTKLCVR